MKPVLTSFLTSNLIPNDAEAECAAVEATDRIVSHESNVDLPHIGEAYFATSPSPGVVDHEVYCKLAAYANAICIGLTTAVRQWTRDERLREILPVPPQVEAVLLAAPSHYEPGFMRPDFLYRGDPQRPVAICEVNARYPLNGLGITTSFNHNFLKECMTPSSIFAKLGLAPDSAMTSLFPDVRDRLTRHGDNTVWALTDTECLFDIDLFAKYCGFNLRRARTSQLACDGPDNGLHFRDPDSNELIPIKAAFLYLTQQEIVSLPEDVFAALASLSFSGGAVNDFRTIFIAHDKRMLHILTSEMLEVDETTRKLLREAVIPTALLNADGTMVPSNFCEQHPSVILKPCLEGKGKGILFQKNMSADEFSAKVQESAQAGNFVVQAFVESPQVPALWRGNKAEGTGTHVRMFKSVGTLFTLDGRFYGNGLLRVSPGDIIAISNGGGMICSVTRATALPSDIRSYCDNLECADFASITRCLVERGVALVGVGKLLGDKEELANFLKKGLGATCRSHSDVPGAVWDVRPRPSWNDKDARSHTTHEFELHTDESFELEPPRFVCMSVIRADAYGGGVLSIGRISDAVAKLTGEERHLLKTVKPRWVVPPEFRKSGSVDLKAPVLMSDTRARFRLDNLEVDHEDEASANAFRAAFASFRRAIESVCAQGQVVVPQQTVFLLDNHRLAHSRSEVLDARRHLHCVRFDLPGADLPDDAT